MIIVKLRSKHVQTSHIRPSIDELGVPSEPWSRVHDRNQKKFSVQVPTVKSLKRAPLLSRNLLLILSRVQLLTGVSLFAVTAMAAINTVATNSTPYNLLKLDVKFDQAE